MQEIYPWWFYPSFWRKFRLTSSKRTDSEGEYREDVWQGLWWYSFGQVTSVHLRRSSQRKMLRVCGMEWSRQRKKHQKNYRSLPLPISKSIIINLHILQHFLDLPIKISKNPISWFITNGILPLSDFTHLSNYDLHQTRRLKSPFPARPSARNNFCSFVWVDPVDPNIPKGRP